MGAFTVYISDDIEFTGDKSPMLTVLEITKEQLNIDQDLIEELYSMVSALGQMDLSDLDANPYKEFVHATLKALAEYEKKKEFAEKHPDRFQEMLELWGEFILALKADDRFTAQV